MPARNERLGAKVSPVGIARPLESLDLIAYERDEVRGPLGILGIDASRERDRARDGSRVPVSQGTGGA